MKNVILSGLLFIFYKKKDRMPIMSRYILLPVFYTVLLSSIVQSNEKLGCSHKQDERRISRLIQLDSLSRECSLSIDKKTKKEVKAEALNRNVQYWTTIEHALHQYGIKEGSKLMRFARRHLKRAKHNREKYGRRHSR